MESFEEKLKGLSPNRSTSGLKERIAAGVARRSALRRRFAAGVAVAAVLAVGFVVVWSDAGDPGDDIKFVGAQEIVIEEGEPVLMKDIGDVPMWKVDLKILNRGFVKTSDGLVATEFVQEDRSVYTPVVYQ